MIADDGPESLNSVLPPCNRCVSSGLRLRRFVNAGTTRLARPWLLESRDQRELKREREISIDNRRESRE